MEGATELVNEDVLGYGKLTALLGLGRHGLPVGPESISRPGIEVKHPPARSALGIVFHHDVPRGRPRRPHGEKRWISIRPTSRHRRPASSARRKPVDSRGTTWPRGGHLR